MHPILHKVRRYVWPGGKWRWPLRAAIIMLPMMLISVEVTSMSGFCRSCHIMESYYVSWEKGSHKNVACVSCHIAPGTTNFIAAKLNGAGQVVDDLLHRTSTKPSASVSDMACTRSGCHDMATVRKIAPREGKFFFDHAKHLDLTYSGIGMHCTTCHSHVKGDEHFEVNTNGCVTCHLAAPGRKDKQGGDVMLASLEKTAVPKKTPPSDCRTCHSPPAQVIDYQGLKVNHAEYVSYGASCESCHNGVTEKPRPVRDDSCFSCHEYGLARHETPEKTHHIHSEGRHKVECFSCHGEARHGPGAQVMQLAELDCATCHQGQHAVQKNTYAPEASVAQGAPPHPTTSMATTSPSGAMSPMFLVHVGCAGCHVDPRPMSGKPQSGALVLAAKKEACDNCHKDGVSDLVDLWQKNTKQLYDGVSQMMPAEGANLSAPQKLLVNEAQSLLELVRQDGSWGVHNPKYTQKLLEDAQQKIAQLEKVESEEAR